MKRDEERTISWVVIAIGLLIFVFAHFADSFGERTAGIVYSGDAQYLWKTIELQRNSIITRVFAILLVFVGCVMRIAAALDR